MFLGMLASVCIAGQSAASFDGLIGGNDRQTGQTEANIISVKDGEIAISNALGCRLLIHRDGNKYGLGTFYFRNEPMGGTVTTFLKEDNHYIWDEYKANRYEIIKNTPEEGTIAFYGVNGDGEENVQSRWLVTITLTNKNTAYQIRCQVEPYIYASRFHPLYVSVPFFNKAMQFVQYPLENPLRPPFAGEWYVYPDVGKVPFMFGKQTIQGTDYFVGVGYSLIGQDYTQGRLHYGTIEPETPFRIYFPYRWYPGGFAWSSVAAQASNLAAKDAATYFRRPPYDIRIIVSTAETQAECIKGYREECGFDISTPVRRRIVDSVTAVMRGFRDAPLNTCYVPGKGYRGRAWSNSDDLADYYSYIWIGSNVQIAYQLYRYWERHRSEVWAKERSIEMAEFFVASQLPSGAVPRNWDEEKQVYTTENPNMPALGFIYCPWNTAQGSENLYKLYLERKKVENVEEIKWKESALHGIDWIVRRVNEEGMLGHTYDKNDKSSGLIGSAPAMALQALDYIYHETGDERYDQARARLEAWYFKTFAAVNEYYNEPDDTYSWRPPAGSTQFKDNSALETLRFAAYCAVRYMETKERRYLRWAEDVTAYGWLTKMPVQMPGFIHSTKGLVEDQAIWPDYDCPWINMSNRVFPYLALLTGDPFYAEYYRLLIQTHMSFQHYEDKYPFFSSVLASTPDLRELPFGQVPAAVSRRPYDRFAETIQGKNGVWLIWATSYFLEEMTAPDMYSYFGGKDWGVGLDYDLPFRPNFGENPYIMAASTELTSAGWDEMEHSLYAFLNGAVGSAGTLKIKWDAVKYPPTRLIVELNGTPLGKSKWRYDSSDDSITVDYPQDHTTVRITVRSQ
jgi:hypothetical protein